MATATAELEERISVLESEVSQLKQLMDSPHLKQLMDSPHRPHKSWWHEIAGTFANSPDFEEAMRLGREYRKSQRDAEI